MVQASAIYWENLKFIEAVGANNNNNNNKYTVDKQLQKLYV